MLEKYEDEIASMRIERTQTRNYMRVISTEVENMLNIFNSDRKKYDVNWNDLKLAILNKKLIVNDKVSFVKVYESKTVMKFRTSMKAGGVFGIQIHDCLEEVRIRYGNLIETCRLNKEYFAGDSLTYKDGEIHKPYCTEDSEYDIIFTKKRNNKTLASA